MNIWEMLPGWLRWLLNFGAAFLTAVILYDFIEWWFWLR